MTGYHIEATDGEIGHVDGFVVDDGTWAIRDMEVAHGTRPAGSPVSPAWIERVSWDGSQKSESASPVKPSRELRRTTSSGRSPGEI